MWRLDASVRHVRLYARTCDVASIWIWLCTYGFVTGLVCDAWWGGGEAGKGAWPKCQEPEVVFSTGMKPLGGDEYLILYGGADSVVGAARVAVTFAQ